MVQDISKSKACAAHYGSDADAMREYSINGQNKALEIDNRGPIVFETDGSLTSHIFRLMTNMDFMYLPRCLKQMRLKTSSRP